MKNIFIILICAFTLIPAEKIEAQEKDVTENIQDIIAKKQFTFLAETAVPSNFRSRPLSFGYDMQVAPDSVISHLPYFGVHIVHPLILPKEVFNLLLQISLTRLKKKIKVDGL